MFQENLSSSTLCQHHQLHLPVRIKGTTKQLNIKTIMLLSYPGLCRVRNPSTLHLLGQTHSQALRARLSLNFRARIYLRDDTTQLPPLERNWETEINKLLKASELSDETASLELESKPPKVHFSALLLPRTSSTCGCCLVTIVSDSCNPMDCSLPSSSVHGISQARILEQVAISFSRGSYHPGIEPMSPAWQEILYHWATWEAPSPANTFSMSWCAIRWVRGKKHAENFLFNLFIRWLWHIFLPLSF